MSGKLWRGGPLLLLCLVLCEGERGRCQAAAPRPNPRLGINLSHTKDWNTELPFVDVFRTSRPWISQRLGPGGGKAPALNLDEHGWVTQLEPRCAADAIMCTIKGGHYPGGIYTVLYEGEGKLTAFGAATPMGQQPGMMQLRVVPERPFTLRLLATNPRNYIRNIRVIMPGFGNKYRENPWNPLLLQRWQGFACVRFMDFMQTNNSTISSWLERPKPDDATFAAKGVPVELLVDLANRLNADPWFCMPHKADDDYVRNFASYVKKNLKPGLKPHIEYSNEIWNAVFKQSAYAAEKGRDLGLPREAAARYTAVRSVEIFRIWEDVFGGSDRLVRILPSQAANAGLSRQIVSFQNAYRHADALAIAPYIPCNAVPRGKPPTAVEMRTWNEDQLFQHLKTEALPKAIAWMNGSKAVANQFNLKLIAYEGGQHLASVGAATNDEAITRLFLAANADPRMGELYRLYFQAWEKAGGDLFCYFNSVQEWTKWGSWGALQYQDDDPAKSPKYMAILQWARSRGQKVSVPGSRD